MVWVVHVVYCCVGFFQIASGCFTLALLILDCVGCFRLFSVVQVFEVVAVFPLHGTCWVDVLSFWLFFGVSGCFRLLRLHKILTLFQFYIFNSFFLVSILCFSSSLFYVVLDCSKLFSAFLSYSVVLRCFCLFHLFL